MLTQDHLILRLIRLKPSEEWTASGNGFSLIFPKGGMGECVHGATNQRVAPGDALVVNEGTTCKVRALAKSEMVFSYFSLDLDTLFPLFASNEICILQNLKNTFKTFKYYAASAPLGRECQRLLADVPPQFNLDHRSQLLRVGAAILSVEFKATQPQRVGFVRVEEHMIQVFEKLSSAELLQLSVGELADKFGCSRRHLNRLFHQHFGVSVASLRMEMRLLKAVSLLRDPDAKVIRVAEDCGFNHLGLFNTCFKKRFGTSPGKWRKLAVPTEKISVPSPIGQPITQPSATPACPLQHNGLCPMAGGANATAAGPTTPVSSPAKEKTGNARLVINIKSADGVGGKQNAASQRDMRDDVYRSKNFESSP